MTEAEAIDRFRAWFVEPIDKLRELPFGNGGFIAFMASLALYERLIVAQLKLRSNPTDPEAVKREMEQDLKLSSQERSIFWDMFRNGLLHHAMPKAGKTGWAFHYSYSAYPEFKMDDGRLIICINPWKFTDRVLQEFLTTPQLVIASESFPLGLLAPVPIREPIMGTDD